MRPAMTSSPPEQALALLGEACDHATHDLLNVLAALKEQAGLLEDLAGMDRKETRETRDRYFQLAGAMRQQVERGADLADALARHAQVLARRDPACPDQARPDQAADGKDGASCPWTVLAHLVRLAAPRARSMGIALRLDSSAKPPRPHAFPDAASLVLVVRQGTWTCLAALPRGATLTLRPFQEPCVLGLEWSWRETPATQSGALEEMLTRLEPWQPIGDREQDRRRCVVRLHHPDE